jgi:hypothetical protein
VQDLLAMRVIDRARRGRDRIREVWAGATRPVGARRGATALSVVAIGFSGLPGPGANVAHVHVTPHDRAAARAYLRAEYAYLRSQIATETAANAASEQVAGTIGAECPGVLANAPNTHEFGELFANERLSARKRGEESRISRQRSELELELSEVFERAQVGANRAAAVTYAHTLDSLHFSSATLTRYEHAKAQAIMRQLTAPLPAVCADMRAWVASGYTKLSPGTKAVARELVPSELVILESLLGRISPDLVLRAYETPGERALVRRINLLIRKSISRLVHSDRPIESLARKLGVRSPIEESEEPPKGAVVIGRGKTVSGNEYTIWVQQEHSTRPGPHCPISLGVDVSERNGNSTSEACLSRTEPERLHVFCNGSEWQVEGQTLEGATSVAVKLRDGRQISSPVVIVPPTLGGPAGFFYQLLPRSDDPVSLTEVNAQGATLATVALPHEAHCPRLHEWGPKPPEPLGSSTLVSGHLPHHVPFVILAFRARFMGRVDVSIHAQVLNPEPFGGGFVGPIETRPEGRRRRPIKLEVQPGCLPHEYALLFGVLKAPQDTVLAKTGHGLKAFRLARLPSKLHLHGVLAYLGLPAIPSEVIVRSPDGRTVYSRSYRRMAREGRETCEGEAEPAEP